MRADGGGLMAENRGMIEGDAPPLLITPLFSDVQHTHLPASKKQVWAAILSPKGRGDKGK